MNYWVIAFPFLMYLGSFGMCWGSSKANRTPSAKATDLAMGIAYIYQVARTFDLDATSGTLADFGTPYYAISISLNVLLTLMIVTRLIRHSRNIRIAMGASARVGGLYKTAITMLVESCALYAVSYILFIGPWAIGNPVSNIFFPILAETQVRGVYGFLHHGPWMLLSKNNLGTGHCPVPHHFKGRQPDSIDEQYYRLRERRFHSFQDSRKVDEH